MEALVTLVGVLVPTVAASVFYVGDHRAGRRSGGLRR